MFDTHCKVDWYWFLKLLSFYYYCASKKSCPLLCIANSNIEMDKTYWT